MRTISFLMMLFLQPAISPAVNPAESSIKMIRSLSGPSGKIIGNKYVLDEVRNRFSYPNENSLIVCFEWQAPIGDYTLSAYWKDPQGKVIAISPDIKIKSIDENLNAYWTFAIDPGKESGVWTVEAKVNGEPAGFHSFELVMPPKPAGASAAAVSAEPTLEEIYRAAIKSLVWVNKLDSTGHQSGRSSGFVVASNSVLTTFQAIDLASKLELEFADGRKQSTNVILGCNRAQDWALLKADIADIPPMPLGKSESAAIGKTMIAFAVGAGDARTIAAVTISGKNTLPGGGEKIYLNVPLPPSAFGSPLLDSWGKVVGVIGLGQRRNNRSSSGFGLNLNSDIGSNTSVTPMEAIPFEENQQPATIQQLRKDRILRMAVEKFPSFVNAVAANPAEHRFGQKFEFRKNDRIAVQTIWQQKGDTQQGLVSLTVYDSNDKICLQTKQENLKLNAKPLIYSFEFSPAKLEPGTYQLEISWDDVPVWMNRIAISE